MKILIVKFGALGDVVRTSYFAEALKVKYGSELELSWITSIISIPLLECNPYIDILTYDFNDLSYINFDIIYSLDDELDVVISVSKLFNKKIVGAKLTPNGPGYTDDSSLWFDMGLLSRLGKIEADKLKKINRLGHAEIFKQIFNVHRVLPNFYTDNNKKDLLPSIFHNHDDFFIGINPYAGGRWPAKELGEYELKNLIHDLTTIFSKSNVNLKIVLLGAGEDKIRSQKVSEELKVELLYVADTDKSIMYFAEFISKLNIIITSDSLAMHLAIAQGKPTLAFFAPTSAAEIDSFGICEKLISTAQDYCSYKKDCDNSSITSRRIIELLLSSSIFKYQLNNIGIEN